MRVWRHLFSVQIMAVAVLAVTAAWAQPQDTRPPVPAANAEAKTALDEIEAALGREELGADELAALRGKLNATADALRANIEDIEPRAREAEERLKQLGPAPAKDAPPETAEIARERAELNASFGQLDGALKEAHVLAVRGDQLSERIAQRRHMLYARELFARSASALDPSLWSDATRALGIELARAPSVLPARSSRPPSACSSSCSRSCSSSGPGRCRPPTCSTPCATCRSASRSASSTFPRAP